MMDNSWKEKLKGLSPEDIAEIFYELFPKISGGVGPKSKHGKAGLAFGLEMFTNATRELVQASGDKTKLLDMSSSVIQQGAESLEGTPDEGTSFADLQRVRYEETDNPLHAWMALLEEQKKSHLPGWLKVYLGSCALNMLDLSVKVGRDTDLKRKKLGSAVMKAFGFKGRKHFLTPIAWMFDQDVGWSLDEERRRAKEAKLKKHYPIEEVAPEYNICSRHVARRSGRAKSWQYLFQKRDRDGEE